MNETLQEEQEKLMKQLKRKYERIELQYDLNDARDNAIDRQTSGENGLEDDPTQYRKFSTKPFITDEILKRLQQQNNYKNLKQIVKVSKKKQLKQYLKQKTSGSKMLKVVGLDNFSKYQRQYLISRAEQQKKQSQRKKKGKRQKKKTIKDESEELQTVIEQQEKKQKDSKIEQNMQIQQKQQEQCQSQTVSLNSYISEQPQNMQQAKQKLDVQALMMDQNMHFRYRRAFENLTQFGMEVNSKVIKEQYDKI